MCIRDRFAFGVNSGAYVAEIIRGGIASIDPGQAEAGRSLGLSAVSYTHLGDKGNASFFGRAAFTPYMVFGIEGI